MNIVKHTEKVSLKVKRSALLEDKYLYITKLSAMLKALEDADNLKFKQLRNKFYNSSYGNKYNFKEVCGLKCIDVENPMKGKASLELDFEIEG